MGAADPFCERCLSIDFDSIAPQRSIQQALGSNKLCPIVFSAGCPLCYAFQKCAGLDNDRDAALRQQSDDNEYFIFAFHTSRTHASMNVVSRLSARAQDLVSFTVITSGDVLSRNESEDDIWDGVMLRTKYWITPLAEDTSKDSFAGRVLPPEVDFSLVKDWLSFCLSTHRRDSCGSFPATGRKMHPIKVIDCSKGKLVSFEPSSQYVALSYVWGDLSASSSQRKSSGSLPKNLPNVIEDAVSATIKLGFKYLWVDRYCIDQNDRMARNIQISQMDLIYSNADITLVAAAGSDPTVGLPGVSTRLREEQVSFKIQDKQYVLVPPDPHVRRPQSSAWYSRGWTYQESVLSRRRLHFLQDQIYFTCGSMYCRDALTSPLSAWNFRNKGRMRATPWYQGQLELVGFDISSGKILTPNTKIPNPLHETFIHINEYSRRSLSNPDDILNGITGIFQRLRALHAPFRQFYGIPIVTDATLMKRNYNYVSNGKGSPSPTFTERLATAMTWYHSDSSSRRPGFPSWSWAGWFGTVKAPGRGGGYIQNTHKLSAQLVSDDGSSIDWEIFCAADQIGEDIQQHPKATINLLGAVYHVRIWRSGDPPQSSWSSLSTHKWRAQVQTNPSNDDEMPVAVAQVSLAGSEPLVHFDGQTSMTCLGLVLGTRCATYFNLGPRPSTVASPVDDKSRGSVANAAVKVVVVLLLCERGEVLERVGIVEFLLDDFDSPELQTRRRQLQVC